MQIFGLAGVICFLAGVGISMWLAFQKLVHHAALGERPMLLLGILLIVVGIQLASLGLVADVLARTYFESQKKPSYYVRTVVRGVRALDDVAANVISSQRSEQLQ
jgi:hypothetical protein